MIYEHVGITVSDLERSIDFYANALGFSILKKTPINAYIYKGTDMIEIVKAENPSDKENLKTPMGLKDLMTKRAGLYHIGFRVDDLDDAVERIEKYGGKLIVPPEKYEPKLESVANVTDDKLKRAASPIGKPFWRIAVFADPDGILIELLER
ncbi:MAG: VOC family protein [Candidatus Aminicenantes bacterium]|nr:MAG: VOC family protein [Candidatus Aminicenantes bacterium]